MRSARSSQKVKSASHRSIFRTLSQMRKRQTLVRRNDTEVKGRWRGIQVKMIRGTRENSQRDQTESCLE